MKTLYIDCSMGAAGDMLMGSLFELIDDKDAFLTKMNSIMPECISVSAEKGIKCGISGTHMKVNIFGKEEHEHHHEHDHHHHEHSHNHSHDHHHHSHNGLYDVEHIIDHMDVSENVRKNAKNIYKIIAEAESEVHGETIDDIHFHEVGSLDAICDVVGNCILMEMIGAEKVVSSPVHVGSGSVKCAHGILPVPAPATALILRGVPSYGGDIAGELCTPTGAALIKYFTDDFGPMPAMTCEKIGFGLGTKDFAKRANCLRVTAGNSDKYYASEKADAVNDDVCELAANIDDMTGEDIAFAMELLMKNGALDVYFEHIIMKKSRPAVKLVCICRENESEKFAKLILKYTSTAGVRMYRCSRFVLERETIVKETEFGSVRVKTCRGYGIEKSKPEYEDIAEIARGKGLAPVEIRDRIRG